MGDSEDQNSRFLLFEYVTSVFAVSAEPRLHAVPGGAGTVHDLQARCAPHIRPETFYSCYMCFSWGTFTSHSPPYWVTTEGDRQPEELESLSRRWFGIVRTLCTRAPRAFYPDVHILATPVEGIDGATSGDPIVPWCATAIIHVKHLWNTWQNRSRIYCFTSPVWQMLLVRHIRTLYSLLELWK